MSAPYDVVAPRGLRVNVEAKLGTVVPLSNAGQALPNPKESTDIFQMPNVLRLLRIRWLLILSVALVLLLAATGVILSLTPRYSAEAIISLDQRTNTITDADAVLSKLSGDAATVQAQLQILRSRSFLSRVIDRTQIESDPAFNPTIRRETTTANNFISTVLLGLRSMAQSTSVAPVDKPVEGEHNIRDVVIDNVLRALVVSPVAGSPTIRIEFRSEDPNQSARMANAIAAEYIEDQLNTKLEASQVAGQFLADRINELRSQVQATEAALAQFKASNSTAAMGQGVSPADLQLGALTSQLVDAKLILSDQTAKVAQIRELQQTGRSADVTEVVDSPILSQLRAEEIDIRRQEAELSSKYGPRHPRIIDLEFSES